MKERFLQSDFWADFKCAHGWKSEQFFLDENLAQKFAQQKISILLRDFFGGKKTLAYIPLAPEFLEFSKSNEQNFLQNFNLDDFQKLTAQILHKINSKKNIFCVRYDFPLDFETKNERNFFVKKILQNAKPKKIPLKKCKIDIQPPDTVLLALKNNGEKRNPQEILSAMKNKWRYNIRLSQKKGVQIRKTLATDKNFALDLESFYKIYLETAKRDGIAIHKKSYYEDLLKRGADFKKSGIKVALYIASHEGEDLACIIVLFCKREAVYLYGCSSNSKRNLMAPYFLQWNAILDALDFGSETYDFYGIPPDNAENHPMHGLYLFKTGFGGKEIHRPGSFDFSCGFFYNFYCIAENFRAFYHKKVVKKLKKKRIPKNLAKK